MELVDTIAFIKKMYFNSKRNAKTRNIKFELDESDIVNLFIRSGGKCEITGIRLSLLESVSRQPWAPSLDRIDSKKGYISGNVRIVCVMANYALNEFGDELFKEMIAHAAKTMGLIKNERKITVNNDEVIRLQKMQTDRIITAINDVTINNSAPKNEETKNTDVMILLKKDVLERTRLSYPTIWRMEREGKFPKRIKLSSAKIGYYNNEIEQWMLNRERYFVTPNAALTGKPRDEL